MEDDQCYKLFTYVLLNLIFIHKFIRLFFINKLSYHSILITKGCQVINIVF